MRSWLIIAVVGALGAQAHADEDHSKADTLFLEAQKLKEAGKGAEACAKFEEALAQNRNAVGTLLNVAKCSEDAGKIATAVKLYAQARDVAREHKLDEHRTAAESRLAAISERVPRLAIAFSERADSMKLVIDDEVFPSDPEATNELRLDPGSRHIVVTAPGRLPYETTVVLVEGKQQAVAIPPLAHPVLVKKARRTVGKVLTFSGAALGLTGLALGYKAHVDYDAQIGPPGSGKPCIEETAGAKPVCDADGYQVTGEARQLGNTGTIVGIVGVAALGIGVFLWFTAPSETAEPRQLTLVPSITNESTGIAAVGRF